MTVAENIGFPLKMTGVSKQETSQRVQRAARSLGLESYLERRPEQLSGGQRQRVALGRAIVREPAVFLMDEPLSNLDAALRVATRAEILKLHQRVGTTTIYVTHDQVEAMTMGDRIAVMQKGVLQQAGTPEELYTRPRNLFVAGFIGSPAMNLVPVEPVTDGGQAMLRRGEFVVRVPERLASAAAAEAGREMVVGLRPEHFSVANGSGPPDAATVPATVDVVEYLGDEQLVHLHSGEVELVAKVSVEPRLHSGQAVTLTVPLDKLYLFDRESESAVALAA